MNMAVHCFGVLVVIAYDYKDIRSYYGKLLIVLDGHAISVLLYCTTNCSYVHNGIACVFMFVCDLMCLCGPTVVNLNKDCIFIFLYIALWLNIYMSTSMSYDNIQHNMLAIEVSWVCIFCLSPSGSVRHKKTQATPTSLWMLG